MFRATNRIVHVVKLEIEAFDPEADVFALTVTLSTFPRDYDCPEAHAVAQAQFPGKKATLALKDVGGKWVYELSDKKGVVNLIGSPSKASAKISGQVVEELKWAIEAEGVPSERLLTLCRWHGSAVDLCADLASEEATNSELPLLSAARQSEAPAITSDDERMIPLSVAKRAVEKAVEKAVKFAQERQAEQDEDDDLTIGEDGKIRVSAATLVEAAAQAREDKATELRAKHGDDELGNKLADALDAEAAQVREEGQAQFGASKFVRGWDKEV